MSNEEKIEIYKNAVKNIKKLKVAGVNSQLRMSLPDRTYYFTAEKLSQFKKRNEIKALNPGKEEKLNNQTTNAHREFVKGLEANVPEKAAMENPENSNQEIQKEEQMSK